MATEFLPEFVKWSQWIQNNGVKNPSADALRKRDSNLKSDYLKHMAEAMADDNNPIANTRRNRSIIALLAASAPGGPKTRVKKACEFWRNVKDLTL